MGLLDAVQDITGFATNPYGTPASGTWNLVEGSFTNSAGDKCVFFYEKTTKNNPLISLLLSPFGGAAAVGEERTQRTALDQITDGGGRRLAVYDYPYQDGQGIDDLGRKGEKYTFNIKFHGLNYQAKFQEFLNVIVNVGGVGTLSHPVRGKVRARFQEYEPIHRHDEWNAVTIRAVFLEDNTGAISAANLANASPNSALRKLMNTITNVQAGIQQTLFSATAVLLVPAATKNAMGLRLNSITSACSLFLGQLASTFSTDSSLNSLLSNANGVNGGLPALSSGSVTGTSSQSAATLPPVFQAGFSPSEQSQILAQQAAFENASTITTQQAVFSANQSRLAISAAIAEIDKNLGNDGFDITMLYRQLAVQLQETTEACISTSQSSVTLYTVPSDMSLRMVAFLNGLSVDSQNDIEALNPYLGSVNLVPRGTILTVPAS